MRRGCSCLGEVFFFIGEEANSWNVEVGYKAKRSFVVGTQLLEVGWGENGALELPKQMVQDHWGGGGVTI